MALKYKVEKIEDVEEAQRALYKQDAAGGFVLDAEGIDDGAELKRAKDHEVEQRKAAEKKLKELQDAQKANEEKIRKAAEDAARAAGNTEALDKSWKEKVDKANTDWQTKYDTDVGSLTADVTRLLIDNVAQTIANEIAIEGSAAILIPHLRARLGVELREGNRVTVVKGPDGKSSALTIDELKKEFAGNKAFAPVIAGSRAAGSGANGARGGGATGAKTIKRSEFDKLSPAERQAKLKPGPDRVTVTD